MESDQINVSHGLRPVESRAGGFTFTIFASPDVTPHSFNVLGRKVCPALVERDSVQV